jgi:hypothetical protein
MGGRFLTSTSAAIEFFSPAAIEYNTIPGNYNAPPFSLAGRGNLQAS